MTYSKGFKDMSKNVQKAFEAITEELKKFLGTYLSIL